VPEIFKIENISAHSEMWFLFIYHCNSYRTR